MTASGASPQPSLAGVEATHRFDVACADAYEALPGVPDSSIDLILTDPPYNISSYSTGNIRAAWRSELNNDIAEWDGNFEPGLVRDHFVRVLKPTGNLFAFTSYNMLGRWHELFDPLFDTFQFMIWHKTNPVPKVRRAGFLNACEIIICCWNRGHTWNFTRQRDMHNFIEAPICAGRERCQAPLHPTQKPLKVLRHIIELASKPGDTVLDPFMGVGSTGVAALELGRCFIGFEIVPEYYEASVRRLRSVPPRLPVPGDAQGHNQSGGQTRALDL